VSLQIYLCREMEPLFAHLAENLHQTRKSLADPFLEPMLVAPHFALQRKLQLSLSRTHGDATGIDWRFPENALQSLVQTMAPESASPPTFVTVNRLRQWIDYRLNAHPMEILEDYLEKNRTSVKPALDQTRRQLRTWALAEQLATLFLGYEFRQPELIELWKENRQKFSPSQSPYLAELEAVEKKLYLEIFGENGFVSEMENLTGEHYKTLPGFAREIFQQISPEDFPTNSPPVYLFCPVKLSQVQIEILFQLSRFYQIELYLQSFAPEMELLETGSVSSGEFEKHFSINRDKEERLASFQNPVHSLASWTEPDREFLYLLSKGNPPGKLEVLPSETHLPDRDYFTVTDKNKIQTPGHCRVEIAAAPSVRREVEAVYQSILSLLKTNPEWKQSDFAILYSDPDSVLPALESVFQSSPEGLHLAVTDKNACRGSLVYEALESFFDLMESGFRQGNFLALVSNPCIRNQLKISSQEVDEWKNLLPELGVYRLHPMQSCPDSPSPYTWAAGLRRLKLGRIMEKTGDAPTPAATPPALSFYSGIGAGFGPEAIGRLCETVDQLLELYQRVHEKRNSAEEWADFLKMFLEEKIELPGGAFREHSIYTKILNGLNQLKEMGALYQKLDYDFHPDPEWIRQFIRQEIDKANIGTGGILTSGITAGPIGALSGTCFRVVYVLGLEEGRFPSVSQSASLDLRQAARSIGDISREEECRWNLLEILANTRDHVFLCYNNRDLQKDREIQPCSPLHEILQQIYQSVDFKEQITQIPLEPVEEIPLDGSSVEDKKSSLLVNYCRRDFTFALLGQYKKEPGSLSRKALDFLSSELDIPCRPEQFHPVLKSAEKEPVRILDIKHLADFLRNPLECTIKRKLGLYDSDEMLFSEMPDEPLFSEFPYNWQLYHDIFWDSLSRMQHRTGNFSAELLSEIIKRNYEALQSQGLAAAAGFAQADQNKFHTDLYEIIASTHSLLHPRIPFFEEAVMGQVNFPAQSSLRCPAGVLNWTQSTGESLEYRFQGRIPYCRPDLENHSLDVLIPDFFSKKAKNVPVSKKAFEALLFYIIGVATGLELPHPSTDKIQMSSLALNIHQLYKEQKKVYPYSIDPRAARQYLCNLLEDFDSEGQYDEIPYENIFTKMPKSLSGLFHLTQQASGEEEKDFNAWFDEFLEDYREDVYSGRNLEALQLLEPQPVENPFQKIKRRFSMFLKETSQKTPRRSRQ
jgi:exodeoxyribonuclease V gamma subunit